MKFLNDQSLDGCLEEEDGMKGWVQLVSLGPSMDYFILQPLLIPNEGWGEAWIIEEKMDENEAPRLFSSENSTQGQKKRRLCFADAALRSVETSLMNEPAGKQQIKNLRVGFLCCVLFGGEAAWRWSCVFWLAALPVWTYWPLRGTLSLIAWRRHTLFKHDQMVSKHAEDHLLLKIISECL